MNSQNVAAFISLIQSILGYGTFESLQDNKPITYTALSQLLSYREYNRCIIWAAADYA